MRKISNLTVAYFSDGLKPPTSKPLQWPSLNNQDSTESICHSHDPGALQLVSGPLSLLPWSMRCLQERDDAFYRSCQVFFFLGIFHLEFSEAEVISWEAGLVVGFWVYIVCIIYAYIIYIYIACIYTHVFTYRYLMLYIHMISTWVHMHIFMFNRALGRFCKFWDEHFGWEVRSPPSLHLCPTGGWTIAVSMKVCFPCFFPYFVPNQVRVLTGMLQELWMQAMFIWNRTDICRYIIRYLQSIPAPLKGVPNGSVTGCQFTILDRV